MKAFPISAQSLEKHNGRDLSGMDLRDYFAAKAMITLIDVFANDETIQDQIERVETVAAASYRLADAMMKARENNE